VLHLAGLGLFGVSLVLSTAAALAATQIAASLRLAGDIAGRKEGRRFGFGGG